MNLMNRFRRGVLGTEESEEDEESLKWEMASAPEQDEAPSKLSKLEQVSRLCLTSPTNSLTCSLTCMVCLIRGRG